jgi:hypothetical protein
MDFAMQLPTDQDIERLARKRANAKFGWYVHATIYICVNAVLILVAYATSRRGWPVFPALGWGFGLAMHGISVFLLGTGSGWREGLVDRERERLLRAHDRAPGR